MMDKNAVSEVGIEGQRDATESGQARWPTAIGLRLGCNTIDGNQVITQDIAVERRVVDGGLTCCGLKPTVRPFVPYPSASNCGFQPAAPPLIDYPVQILKYHNVFLIQHLNSSWLDADDPTWLSTALPTLTDPAGRYRPMDCTNQTPPPFPADLGCTLSLSGLFDDVRW